MPVMERISAVCLPKCFSSASLISPTVALACAALTASSSKLPLPVLAHSVNALNAFSVAALSRSARNFFRLAICSAHTAELSTLRTSMVSSTSGRYLFTPMTDWRPESILACVRAAASSMRILGIPASMALAMPPNASTSWMCAQAFCASS